MKNFKLLLVTTAMLSTGAVAANAYLPHDVQASAAFKAKAEIIKDLNLEVKQHLDFGRIIWAFDDSDYRSITIVPDGSGTYTPTRVGVKFHDGEQVAKICFSDIVPSATLNNGLLITDTGINGEIYDAEEHQIGYIDMGEGGWIDAGATDGVRCFYRGGEIDFANNDYAKNFSGTIERIGTVTVIFDDGKGI